jgi:hypothetical protein
MQENGRDLILRYYFGIWLDGQRNTTETLSQDRWPVGRNLKLELHEYETES